MADEKQNKEFKVSEVLGENTKRQTREFNVSETQRPDASRENSTLFSQTPEKETTVHQDAKETSFNQDVKETTVNEELKETTVNEESKETTFNEETKETTVNEEQKEETPTKSQENENDDTDGGDGDEINRKTDDKEEDGDEEKGPFKKGDVIDYMYEDWLIGGANFLWAWSAKKIKTLYYAARRKKNRKKAEKNKIKDIEKYDAYQWKEKYEKKALDDSKAKSEKFEEYNGLVELCDKIRDGKVDETNLPEKTKTLVKNMPPQDFKKFFDKKRIKKCQDNMKDNMIAARQFANLYATAAMVEPKIQDKSFTHPNGNDNAFAQLQKEGLTFYVKALNREAANGGNVTALGDKLLKTAQKAVEEMDKNLENGRFDGFEKKKNDFIRWAYRKVTRKKYGQPKQNQAWEKLGNMLQGIDTNEPPANMLEAMILEQDFDKGISDQMEKLKAQEYTEQARKQNLEKRKKQLEEAKARILSDPAKKKAREEKEGIRAQKRAQLIKRLQNPAYKAPNMEGKPDQQFTDMLRQRLGVSR